MDKPKLRTLDDFIYNQINSIIPRSEWVTFFGFRSLYIRYGPRYVGNQKHLNVCTFASGTAMEKGKHVVDKFLRHLIHKHLRTTYIFFESIINEELQLRLKNYGFNQYQDFLPPTLYIDFDSLKEVINNW